MKGKYPDNSDIYALKAGGRRRRAAISFAEKLDAVDRLKAHIEPMVHARGQRKRLQALKKEPNCHE